MSDTPKNFYKKLLGSKGEKIAEKYLKLFCEKTGTDEKYARTWIPLIAAAQLVKGKAENRAILMKHVNSVE